MKGLMSGTAHLNRLPTATCIGFFENQNSVLLELSVGVWKPTQPHKVGDVVRSLNLGGYFARCIKAGTSGDVEPIWAKDNTTSDASCKWAVYMPVLKDDLKPYATKQDVADAIKSALLAAFPVGTIIETKVDVNPGAYIGGTWKKVPANLCLQTGNASEAGTQRSAGLPNITGRRVASWGGGDYSSRGRVTGCFKFDPDPSIPTTIDGHNWNSEGKGTGFAFDASLSNPIYGSSDTVQPPAYMIIAWVRTA